MRRADRRRRRTRRAGVAVAGGALGLLLLTATYLWLLGGTAPRGAPPIGGPFKLTRDDGRPVTERDFRGRFMLVYFGYTSCPDICPMTLGAVSDAVASLGGRAAKLRPVFITVDPRRDTTDVIRAFVGRFGSAIVGLTGAPAQIRDVERRYRIVSIAHPLGESGGEYTVDHTGVLYLMGPDGRYLASLSAMDSGPELAKRIAPYLDGRSDRSSS
ncbi:MAG TPA: SCO family protein [Acetobacteraceae bacterium]|nr:SCO family protein [Acetobacteraceae bacterium]